jgi:LDH2 family malate/lactate/ureidoglycolate dehydrogenase
MTSAVTSEYRLATEPELKSFVSEVLTKVGVTPDDAAIVADVLVAADLRGIESHGVARLETYYVSRIRKGLLEAQPVVTTVRETPTSVLVDAGNGLGHPTAKRTMERVLEKAAQSGAAFGAVRNSNHFGIAGYYAMMALDRDIIGIAFGNGLPMPNDPPMPGKISHFFAAFKIDGFRDPEQFKADMDTELRAFKDSQKAPGQDRIYVAGEIEHEKTIENRRNGVPVHVKVWEGLQKLAGELGIPFQIEKR